METSSPASTRPVRTRRRRALACQPCRQKKLRCDRQQPCRNCTRAKDKQKICSYAAGPGVTRRGRTAKAATLAAASPSLSHVEVSDVNTNDHISVAAPNAQQQQWERENPHASAGTRNTPLHTPSSTIRITSQADAESTNPYLSWPPVTKPGNLSRVAGNISNPISSMMVKTRYMAPSTWLYSVLLIPQNFVWLQHMVKEKGECWQTLQACKSLAKRVKKQQTLPWIYGDYGKLLPQRAMADLLVENYLRTSESIHRIFHIPSFKRDYDCLWEDRSAASLGFIIQVQLCCAIGALLYDDEFSLRSQVMQWIQEAGAWLESCAKPRLMLFTIQTMCLHRIARENTQGTYGDRVWILSGTLIRSAMSIGLHRDPNKLMGISSSQAELRRRLWATVLELALDSCLDPGAAPLIALDDFDCALPSNLDDEQLSLDDDNVDLAPQSPDCYTASSLQIALGQSFATRLAIARFPTKLENDYEEALKLNEELTAVCHSLSESLRPLHTKLSAYQRQYLEMIMCRYVFTLHLPYVVAGSKNQDYALSRTACVDAAVSLAHFALPISSTQDQLLAAVHAMNTDSPRGEDFVRLCICASGSYRSVLFQAVAVIAAELTTMANESTSSFRWSTGLATGARSLSGNTRALELLSLLRVANEWTKRRLMAGPESNKDHLFVSLCLANIEATRKGASVKEAMDAIGQKACSESKAVLEGLSAASGISSVETSDVSEGHFSPDDDYLWMNDMWLIQPGSFGVDFAAL